MNRTPGSIQLDDPTPPGSISLRAAPATSFKLNKEKGLFENVSFISRGPAKGHGFDIDDVMLQQVADAINKHGKVPARLTHPDGSLFSRKDPIEVLVGHASNARVEAGQVKGDIQLGSFARHSPSGDLYAYLLALAEEAPQSVGLSIEFIQLPFERRTNPQTQQSLPPAGRVKDVIAVDFVGNPAANPKGLLHQPPQPEHAMKTNLLKFLRTIGLATDASEQQAAAFVAALTGKNKKVADALAANDEADVTKLQAEPEEPAKKEPAAPAGSSTTLNTTGNTAAPNVAEEVQKALTAERKRADEITALASKHKLTNSWLKAQLASGRSVADVTALAEELVRFREENRALELGGNSTDAHGITVLGDNNIDSLEAAVSDAIALRVGEPALATDERGFILNAADGSVQLSDGFKAKTRAAHDRAREFRGLPLVEVGRRFLCKLGVKAEGMYPTEVADLLFNRTALARKLGSVMLAHSTSDFPFILANTAGRTLRRAYMEAPRIWPKIARRTTHPNFKTIERVQLGEVPNLSEVPEGLEYGYVTVGEGRVTYRLATYGKRFKITRQAVINDDLDAFSRVPRMMGAAASRKEDQLVIAVIVANPTMPDGIALFHASHNNLNEGGASVPDIQALNDMAAAMGTQQGLTTDADEPIVLDLEPSILLHPRALEGTVRELLESKVNPATTNNTKNIWEGRLNPVGTGRLDADSAAAWYLFADNSQVDTFEMCFLEGEAQPVLDSEDEFATDARSWKVRHNAAAAAIDYRGVQRNDGP